MYAYCLYCQTYRCRVIAQLLEMRDAVSRSFSPQIVKRQRKKGVNIDQEYDLLPGYVFVFSEEALDRFDAFRGIDGIIRRVGSEETQWRLTDADLEFAMNLYQKDGKVGQLVLFKEGDAVRIADPLFNGCEGRVTQIDLRKQRARVDYKFANMDCFTWIACDLISRIEEKEKR